MDTTLADLYLAPLHAPVGTGVVDSSVAVTGMIPTDLDFADVSSGVLDILSNVYVEAAIIALAVFAFAPRALRLIKGATRGR